MSEERKDGTIESDMVEENSNIVEKQEAVFADEEVFLISITDYF